MSRSCSVDTYCRNKEGVVVKSLLWEDCLKFSNQNRLKAQQMYAVGTSESFLKMHKRSLMFDDNGQITFNCLKKLAKFNIDDKEMVKKVSEEFNRSGLSFEEAIETIIDFNKKSRYNKECLAILTYDKSGKYTISVVENNSANKLLLKDIMKQKALQDYLIEFLKKHGCDVEFLETDEFRGMYDTTSLEKNYKGLYTLIKIAKNQPIEEQNKALAKEIGHFAIGILGKNNPLLTRLNRYFTPEVVKTYIKKYESDAIYAGSIKREVLGHIVGEYILNDFMSNGNFHDSAIKNLLDRIKGTVFKILRKTRDEGKLLTALANADSIIEDVVNHLKYSDNLYDKFSERLDNLIKNNSLIKEQLYDSNRNSIKIGLEQIKETRKELINYLKRKDAFKENDAKQAITIKNKRAAVRQMQRKLDDFVLRYANFEPQTDDDLIAFKDAIICLLNQLSDEINDCSTALQNYAGYSDFTMRQNIMQTSKDIYELGLIITTNLNCCNILSSIVNNDAFERLRYGELINTPKRDNDDIFNFGNQSDTSVDLSTYDNHDDVFDNITKASKQFENPDGTINRTSGYYEDSSHRKYIRFHRLLEVDRNGYNVASTQDVENNISEETLRASEKGSRTDAFLRIFLTSKGTDFDGAVNAANNTQVDIGNLQPKLFDLSNEEDYNYLHNIANRMTKLMQLWANNGIKWKTEDLVISTQLNNMRIAGELDLLLKYPDGRLIVWDFKTTDKRDSDEYSPLKNVNYEAQVNFYARALRDMGYDAEVGGIIQLKPTEALQEDRVVQFKPRFSKSISSLRVQPYQRQPIDFILSLERQYNQESNNTTGTIVNTQDKSDRHLSDGLNKSKEHIQLYIEKYYPQYKYVAASWLSNYSGDRDNAWRLLVYLGITPKTNEERTKFNQIETKNDITQMKNLHQLLLSVSSNYSVEYQKLRDRICKLWLQDFLGTEVIKTKTKGIYFDRHRRSEGGKMFYAITQDVEVTPEEALSSIDSDLSVLEFLLKPVGRTASIPAQVTAKMINAANNQADKEAYVIWKELIDLKKEYRHFFGNRKFINDLYERDKDGKVVGYYISKTKYGQYSKDIEDFQNKCRKEFDEYRKNTYGDDWDAFDDYTKALKWEAWYKPQYREFHFGNTQKGIKGHSVKTRTGEIIPNIAYVDETGSQRYYNDKYDSLSNEQKELLNKIIDIKKHCDRKLGNPNITELYRAPQIYGKWLNRVTNDSNWFLNTLTDNFITNSVKSVLNKLFENNDDIEDGNNFTESSKYDWYGETVYNPSTHRNVVPMFFIKKLQHPERMSTDIFGSMAAYASMACGYRALSNVSDMCELVNNKIQTIKAKNDKLADKLFGNLDKYSPIDYVDNLVYFPSNLSRAFRFYLESNLYSRKAIAIPNKKDYLLRRTVDFLSKAMVFRFLAGNLHGAAVNLGTGINEVWKEAAVGEDIDFASMTKAHITFITWLPQTLLGTIQQVPNNKVSAWFRYFNARGDNAYQDKNRQTILGCRFSINELLMSPYTLGDYYMQGISYLADAYYLKVIDENGKIHSFFDIYEEHEGLLKLNTEHTYFLYTNQTKDLYKHADYLRSLLSNLESKQKDHNGHNFVLTEVDLSADDKELLQNLGVNIELDTTSEEVIYKINKLLDNNIVTEGSDVEFNYINKCRALDDRMHGIYNKANKPAINGSVISSMLLSMRGYLLGYIERDLSSSRYDITLQRSTEGSILSFIKYLGYRITNDKLQVIPDILMMSVGSMLSTIPIISPLSYIITKREYFNELVTEKSDLGEFQVNNFKRIAAKVWNIAVLQILAGLCKAIGKGIGDDDDDDDDDDNKIKKEKTKDEITNGWLKAYYIIKRTEFEQLSATILLGLIPSLKEGFQTGWTQEINRNSSIVPQQLIAMFLWIKDFEMLAGLATKYKNAEDYFDGPIREDYPRGKKGDSLYKNDLKEWNKKNNAFYNKTHVSRNKNMLWELDENGDPLLDDNGNKIPIYKTPFSRALHNEAMAGDAKFWDNLIKVLPFLKSVRVFSTPEVSWDNYLFGQQMNR